MEIDISKHCDKNKRYWECFYNVCHDIFNEEDISNFQEIISDALRDGEDSPYYHIDPLSLAEELLDIKANSCHKGEYKLLKKKFYHLIHFFYLYI